MTDDFFESELTADEELMLEIGWLDLCLDDRGSDGADGQAG